jgi:HK97 family phage major capsid protein
MISSRNNRLANAIIRSFQRKDRPDDDAGNTREQRELKAQLDRIQEGLKTFAEESKKRHGDLSAETKQSVDKLLVEQTAALARLTELEQKLAKRGEDEDRGRPVVVKSLGQQVAEDEGMIAMGKSGRGRHTMDVKLVSGLTAAAGGATVNTERLQILLEIPRRRLTVRDLITPGTISVSAFEYVRQLGFTNSAAPVAETAAKPESNLTFELITATVITVAHWIQASRQILADSPQLQSFIDGQLLYGLKLKEEGQLMKGSGTGGNLPGLYTTAVAFADPLAGEIATPTRIDTLRLAMLQAELAEFPATGIVLHPADWAAIELTKDTTGQYVFANPVALAGPTLWGQPVVATKALDINEFLVGAFQLGAQIFDREQASVLVSTEDRDNFIKNLVTILCEERLALAIYRPEAFVKGELVEEA